MAVAGAAEAVGPDSSRDEADESQGQRGKGALDSATGALSHRDGTSPVAASAAPEAPASSQAPGAEGARSDVTPRVEANGEPPGGGGGAADEQRGDGDSSNAARPPPPDAAQAVGGERAAGVAAGGVQNGGGGAARPSVEVSRAGSGSLLTSPPRLFPALLPDWAAAFDYSDVSSDSGDDDEGGERGAGAGGGVAASERLRRLWNEVATNLTHVVNDPRLRGRTGEDWLERSLAELDDESGTAARPPAAALGSSADLGAAITRRSFDTYVSQLRHARRGAGLAPTPRRSRGGRGASFGTDGGGASGHPMASSEAVAQVPDEFFSSSFSLRDPDTFARMLCAPAMLVWQERLSHWLDVVEMALLARIEAKSDSFFSALTTLQGLEGDVGAATRAVLTLRQHVAKLQSAGAVRGLAVLGGGRRRTNMKKALELARLLAGVSSARQLVAQLIQQEDFGGALDVIERTERLVAGRLGGVAAAEVIMRQLEQKRRLVGTTLQSGYVAVAVRLLIAGPDDGDAEANGDRNKATGARSSDEGGAQAGGGSSARAWRGAASDAVIEAELRPLLIGIARVGPTCLETALRTFQTRLLDGVHALVKTVVHESLVAARPGDAAAAEPTAPGVSRKVSPAQLKSLDANDLLDVLSSLLEALFALLRRARAAHHVVERVLDGGVLRGAPTLAGAEGDPAPSGAARAATAAPSLVDEAEEELRGSAATGRDAAAKLDRALRSLSLGVVAAAADKAQRLVARLLAARGDANETLRVADMVSMWNLCSSFADAADAVAGTRVTALRTELTGQGRRLLERVHERALQRQERLLDAELWKPTDVPVEVQAMADRLVAAPDAAAQHDGEGAAEGSGAWSNSVGSAGDGLLVRWSPPPRGSGGADARGAAGTNASGRRAVPKTHLLVGGQRFRVVGSILVMVQVLSDYATVATEMPPLAGAVVRRLAALLRRVNARTIELVLQAQARKAAGLKSITTKHLAMACQSMCVLAALVPPLRATCLLALQPHEHILLEELGGVARDIESHVDRLLDKMVASKSVACLPRCDGSLTLFAFRCSHGASGAALRKGGAYDQLGRPGLVAVACDGAAHQGRRRAAQGSPEPAVGLSGTGCVLAHCCDAFLGSPRVL